MKPKEPTIQTQRNIRARGGECLGSVLFIVGVFTLFFNLIVGVIITFVGLIVFLYGRFNE